MLISDNLEDTETKGEKNPQVMTLGRSSESVCFRMFFSCAYIDSWGQPTLKILHCSFSPNTTSASEGWLHLLGGCLQ